MAEAIYVRFEGRYWRLSVLLKRYGISATAGYKRHVAYGRPKHYRKWMLKPTGPKAAKPIPIIVDGIKYESITLAGQELGVPRNRMCRRVQKYGTKLTKEQLQPIHSNGGIENLRKEWGGLSNKKNTGAGRL